MAELVAGSIGFWWSTATSASPKVRIGSLEDLIAANAGLPIADGFPAYVPEARAFIMTLDPDHADVRVRLAVHDGGPGFEQPVFVRGDCVRPGDAVLRRYLEVLANSRARPPKERTGVGP